MHVLVRDAITPIPQATIWDEGALLYNVDNNGEVDICMEESELQVTVRKDGFIPKVATLTHGDNVVEMERIGKL